MDAERGERRGKLVWLRMPSRRNFGDMGASIYDVRTEGGGGVSPKEDVVREVA